MEHRIVHILWTGGLESTYRVCELSKTDCVVQPHYIIFKGIRKSQRYELKAIKKITEILKKDQRTKATILPPIVISLDDQNQIEDYPDIKEAQFLLETSKYYKSRQYSIFARFARQEKLKLEEIGDGSGDPLFYGILLLIEFFSLPLRCFLHSIVCLVAIENIVGLEYIM